jgi:hypothetical protein
MITEQDFIEGIDFTGINPATGADHNTLVNLAVPATDRGMILCSTDTELDVPDVPVATTVLRYKNYLWKRTPHASDTDQSIIIYAWNDENDSDATLLKWQDIRGDLAQLRTDVTTVQASLDNLTDISNAANATATAANNAAATAVLNSTNALANSETATESASEAITRVTEAEADLVSLQSQLTTGLATVNSKKELSAIVNPSATNGQKVETVNGAVSWYSEINKYVKVSEVQNKGIDAGNSILGDNLRSLNLEDNDAGGLAVIADGKITLKPGTYRCLIRVVGYGSNKAHQAFLREDDGTVVLNGTSVKFGDNGSQADSIIAGVFTYAVDTILKISDYWSAAATKGLGIAANVHPDAGGKEVYTVAEFWKIG